MIALNATQALYASKAALKLATLVRIRTYSNVLTDTISETFYLSALPLRYEWAPGVPVQFEPVLKAVSPVVRGIPHIPDGITVATRDGITLELDGRARGPATFANGWAGSTDVISGIVPIGATLHRADGFAFQRVDVGFLSDGSPLFTGTAAVTYAALGLAGSGWAVPVRAVASGFEGNTTIGAALTFTAPIVGIPELTEALLGFAGAADATDAGLWTRFQARQLLGARVDVASLILPPDIDPAAVAFDFSSMGSVHTMRWRGEVASVLDFGWESGRISLACDTIEPSLSWPVARNPALADPRDIGKRYPIPFGIARQVDLVGIEVGHSTTLVGDVAETGTGAWSITDGFGFPTTGTGQVKVGEEIVLANFGTSSTTSLAISARAQAGTVSQAHPRGSTVIELVREARWVMSAVEAQALATLYWQLSDGQRVRIPNSSFGFNPGNDALEPGRSLAVVSFDAEQLTSAIDAAAAQLQQPAYELGENSIVRLTYTGSGTGNAAATGGTGALNSTFAVSASPTGLLGTHSIGAQIYGSAWAIDTGFSSQQVIRLRPVIDNELTSDGAIPTQLNYLVPSQTISGSTISSGGIRAVRTYTGGATPDRRLTPGLWITPSVAGVWTVADLVGSGIGAGVRCITLLRQDTAPSGGPLTQALVHTPSSYWEIEVAPPDVVRTRAADSLAAFTVGNGLRLVADCRGLVTRSSEAAVSALDFSTTTGWAGINCSLVVATALGRQGIRLETATDEAVDLRYVGLDADWSTPNASISVEVFIGLADKDRLESTEGKAIEIRLESLGGQTFYRFGPADLVDNQWTTLVIDLTRHPNRTTTGTGADLAAVANIRFGVNWRVGTIPPAATPDVWFRNVRFSVRTLAQQALDVGLWLVETFAGLTGSVDLAAFAIAKTNTPLVNLGGELRRLGTSFSEILARLEYETRVSWIQLEGASGTVLRPQAALSTYAWPAPARTLTNFRNLTVSTREASELASEFSALYDYRPDFDARSIEAFRELVRAEAGANDISVDVSTASILAAQDLVGVRRSEPQEFLALPSLAAVVEVWAYYVREALRFAGRRFSMVVEYQQAADLEPGDIVEFTTPWDGLVVKCRVIRVAYPLDAPGVGVTLEEVT